MTSIHLLLLFSYFSSSPTSPPLLLLLLSYCSSSPTSPLHLFRLLSYFSSSPTSPLHLLLLFTYFSSAYIGTNKGILYVISLHRTSILIELHSISLLLHFHSLGRLSVQEISLLVDRQHLQQLKSQCGGLQTLLKNHSHIFEGMCICLNLEMSLQSLLCNLYDELVLYVSQHRSIFTAF